VSDQDSKRADAGQKGKQFFEDIWARGDFWNLEQSPFEHAKYDQQFALLSDRGYERTLEIGCAAGTFTRMLAQVSRNVLALDISEGAIKRATSLTPPDLQTRIAYHAQDIMDRPLQEDEAWDLVVMNETIYYIGWLYPFFNVCWMAFQLFKATRPGGRLLMANTLGLETDYLLLPCVIKTYESLLLNVGFYLEKQETFKGTKDGVEIETLLSLFVKPDEA